MPCHDLAAATGAGSLLGSAMTMLRDQAAGGKRIARAFVDLPRR